MCTLTLHQHQFALWQCLLTVQVLKNRFQNIFDKDCCLPFCFRVGLDLYKGVVRDNKKAGVLEPAVSKIKSLKFATEAAITILRIDDMIKLAPEQKDGNSYEKALRSGQL